MKRRFLILVLPVIASAAAAQPSHAPAASDSPLGGVRFDGAWAFSSTTSSGNCPSLAPTDVIVQGGHVVAVNGGAAEPWGYVESDGTIVVRLTVNGHIARANGALRGDSGTGAWSSSTDLCGGNWRAQRNARAGR